MATKVTGQGASGLSRRDFLKASAAATAVVGCGLNFAYDPAKAAAYEGMADYTITTTTCPYCSASCGQRVVVAKSTHPNVAIRGKVVDIYGDFESVFNTGGLCSKGAGSLQLVNNSRRIGAWAAGSPELGGSLNHPAGSNAFLADPAAPNGVAYKSTGTASGVNTAWTAIPLDQAMGEIADGLKAARDNVGGAGVSAPSAANGYNSKGVAFFGSSHMNSEGNYLYRKLIANFGTSNVEHQARI